MMLVMFTGMNSVPLVVNWKNTMIARSDRSSA